MRGKNCYSRNVPSPGVHLGGTGRGEGIRVLKRCILLAGIFLVGVFSVSPVWGYFLAPGYLLKRMTETYRNVVEVSAVQRVEVYGEDATLPFASLDEKVTMTPLAPLRIWVDGKEIPNRLEGEGVPEVTRSVLKVQQRFEFYRDVFLIHEVYLLKIKLERMGIPFSTSRLALLESHVSWQLGASEKDDTKGLWLDRDLFIPLRLTYVLKDNETSEAVDIRYGDYRPVKDKLLYPFEIEIYVNGRLALRIKASQVTLRTR
jgi:hypothetical protein